MDDFLYYFAYGSNMCRERFMLNVPGAESVGWARLSGYKLVFIGEF